MVLFKRSLQKSFTKLFPGCISELRNWMLVVCNSGNSLFYCSGASFYLKLGCNFGLFGKHYYGN